MGNLMRSQPSSLAITEENALLQGRQERARTTTTSAKTTARHTLSSSDKSGSRGGDDLAERGQDLDHIESTSSGADACPPRPKHVHAAFRIVELPGGDDHESEDEEEDDKDRESKTREFLVQLDLFPQNYVWITQSDR